MRGRREGEKEGKGKGKGRREERRYELWKKESQFGEGGKGRRKDRRYELRGQKWESLRKKVRKERERGSEEGSW